jgi:hypothetical protein
MNVKMIDDAKYLSDHPLDSDDDPRKPIFDVLSCLRRDYERAAAPWLKMLADYEAAKPPRHLLVPQDYLLNAVIDAHCVRKP